MAQRFTVTEKWSDGWFANLKPLEKLLFIYLCDNCDCAGFIEVLPKRWASDIGVSERDILGAKEGLRRGLIYSTSEDCIYIRNFLKHQSNLPLNELNNAHKGIFKRFELYREKFKITDINSFIEGATKGLNSPLSNSNSNGISNSNTEESKKQQPKETLKEQKTRLLEQRRELFYKNVFEHKDKYPVEMLEEFFNYWAETNKSGSQMKWEERDTWELPRRLITWKKNNEKFNKPLFHDSDY